MQGFMHLLDFFFWINTQKQNCWIICQFYFWFFFFRLLHTIFHSGCTTLHSHQQYMRSLFPSHSLQHTSCFYLLIIAILGNEVIHHCGFDLHFPSNQLNIVYVLAGHLYVYFRKNVYSGALYMLLIRLFIFMVVELYEFFIYFGYNFLSDI